MARTFHNRHLVALLAVLATAPAAADHIHTPFDLNSDGNEDLLYQEPSKGIVRLTTVSSDGRKGTSSHSLGGRTTKNHRILGTGDFDADGKIDLLWWNLSDTSRQLGFWYVNADNYSHDRRMEADTDLPALDPNVYDLAAVGDFNGDGTSDIIFHRKNATGSNPGGVIYWTIKTDGTIKQSGTLANVPYEDYDLVGAGDFNGDGVSDILFHNKLTGGLAYWHLKPDGNGVKYDQTGTFEFASYNDWRVVGIGDMDADGNSDLLFHRKSTGSVSYWLINSSGTGRKSYGAYTKTRPSPNYRILGLRHFNQDGKADVLFQNRVNGVVMYWLTGGTSGGTATIAHEGVYNVLGTNTNFPGSSPAFDVTPPSPPNQSQSVPSAPVTPIVPNANDQDVKGMVALYARHSGNTRTEGWYDSHSNRTFFAFAGCDTSSSAVNCYSHPSLAFYDHAAGEWSGAFRIANSPFYVDNNPSKGYLADAHTYPEVLVDSRHRVHVFHSGHVSPLKHWISNVTSNNVDADSGWTEASLGTDPSLANATYVKIFKDKNDDLAVLWRNSLIGAPPLGDPCELNQYDIEETWMIIRSFDDGNTWTAPQALFDPEKGDTWDTVYLDAVKYHPGTHRLHMTFKLTRFHNCYYDKFYYAYLGLTDMKLRAPTGAYLGSSISQTEMEDSGYKMSFHADGEQAFRSHQVLIGVDRQNRPHIFHTNYNGTSRTRITHRYWTGSAWSSAYTLQPGSDRRWLTPLDVSFSGSQNRYDLYWVFADVYPVTPEMKLLKSTYARYTRTTASTHTPILGFRNPRKTIYETSLVHNSHPDARLMISMGTWLDWESPKSNGLFYVWGDSGFLDP